MFQVRTVLYLKIYIYRYTQFTRGRIIFCHVRANVLLRKYLLLVFILYLLLMLYIYHIKSH